MDIFEQMRKRIGCDYISCLPTKKDAVRKELEALPPDACPEDEMKRFFYADFIGIIQTLIDGTEKDMNLSVATDFKEFLGNLYTEALAGVLIDWVKDRKKYNREKVLQYLSLIMRTSLPAVLTEAAGAKNIISPTN